MISKISSFSFRMLSGLWPKMSREMLIFLGINSLLIWIRITVLAMPRPVATFDHTMAVPLQGRD